MPSSWLMHLALFAVLRPKTFMLQAALQVSKAIFRVAAMSSFRVCRHPSLTLAPGKDSDCPDSCGCNMSYQTQDNKPLSEKGRRNVNVVPFSRTVVAGAPPRIPECKTTTKPEAKLSQHGWIRKPQLHRAPKLKPPEAWEPQLSMPPLPANLR